MKIDYGQRIIFVTLALTGLTSLLLYLWYKASGIRSKKELNISVALVTVVCAGIMGGFLLPTNTAQDVFDILIHEASLFSAAWLSMIGISIIFLVLVVFLLLADSFGKKGMEEEGDYSRRRFLQQVGLAIPALTLAGTAGVVWDGDRTLTVQRHALRYRELPPYLVGYKLAQISDVHMGPYFDLQKWDEMMARILAEKPQRLVITGDLIDDLAMLPELCARLERDFLKLPDGIDYIVGNHEYFRNMKAVLQAFAPLQMRVLINENICLDKGGQPVYLAGVDYPIKDLSKENRDAFLDKALSGIPKEAFVILLAHHPHFIEDGFAREIPLILAGHSHGGQINFFGAPVLPFSYPFWRGLYEQDGKYGYVSTGTGHWFPLRINCPREVSIFTFQ